MYTKDQAAEYTANVRTLTARHRELLDEYTHPEWHLRGSNDALEAALTEAGERLAYTPPLMEKTPGVWVPKSKGLLHGRHGEMKDVPLLLKPLADVIPVEEWAEWLGGSPDLRPFTLGIKDQNGYGSCTCESGSAGVECVNNFARGDRTVFNPLAVYGRVNGGSDSGSSLEDVIAFLQKYGAFPESVWPRSKGWRTKPSDEAYAAAENYRLGEVYAVKSKTEMGTALIQRKPVHYWYDGHAVLAVALLSTTQFLFQNSWGDWGDNGYGTMSFSSVGYSGFYAYGSTHRPEE